ncbi:MAG: hypothetical protein F6K41_26070 [Symploca sp. SIO3E6]|nr:hypothetical protein [Caldora sp. SIO3E6]
MNQTQKLNQKPTQKRCQPISQRRKGTMITLSLFSVAFLGILPAMAELGDVWTQFMDYTGEFQIYTKEQVKAMLKPIEESDSEQFLTGSEGDLGISNPNRARKNAEQKIDLGKPTDAFENNSVVRELIVGNEIDRQITRGAVDGVLGKEGQTRMKDLLNQTQTTVDNIEQIYQGTDKSVSGSWNSELNTQKNQIKNTYQEADGEDNTQDVVKLMVKAQYQHSQLSQEAWEGLAALQVEQSKILGEMLSSTTQINKDQQYTNLNLTNISRQMDEANRARRVEEAASAANLFRVAAQTDLLLGYSQEESKK